ncbi:hypothetical protein CEXT_796671 [Caerostris extrusa]|uniref:Uncharacterized protein n=1 Tax=Caerostris extrusa TaxID=172846 RepID=A0AAV4QJ70_CAEEX|nr:hypothetical protein CEXT_796671 [Caerostris extrusa]
MNFANRFPTSRRFAAATAKRPIASKMQSASPHPLTPEGELIFKSYFYVPFRRTLPLHPRKKEPASRSRSFGKWMIWRAAPFRVQWYFSACAAWKR